MVRAQTITVGGAPHGNVLIRENTDTGRQRRRDKLLHKAASPGLKRDSDTERRSLQFKTDGQSCSVVSMSLIVTSGGKK